MFRLMNQGIAKSEYEARKDAVTSDESPIVQYKSQAADGCQQCQKLENAFIETQKKLERTQRQLTKANDYNEDLRKQIHWLSAELHEIRSKSKNKSDVGTQVQLTSETNDYKSSLCLKEEKIKSEDNKQALGNHLKETAKPLHDEDGIGNSLSIAEELKQAAEEAVEETGYVYDEASGLYYDKNSGYYYNPETALHYDSNTGTYYTYDSVSGTYIFHSQVDTSYVQQSHEDTTSSHYPAYTVSGSYQGDTTSAHYPAYEVPDSYQGDTTTGSYEDYQETDAQNYGDSFQDYRDPSNTTFTPSKKNKKRKKKAKKAQDLAENQADSTIDSVTNALQNIQVKDSSIVTKTCSSSSQVNSSQGSISSTATTSSELSKKDVTKVNKHKEPTDCVTSPVCKDCGKTDCKIHSLQEETLYQGNLSDDTQNAVDFDFVIKVKHENGDDCKQSNTTDLGTGTSMEESCVKEGSQSMEDDSTLKCPASVDTHCSTLETVRSSQPVVLCDKNETLNLKGTSDERSDGEDSWSVCTNDSELESGELTESSEESDASSEEDKEMIQEQGEDQDPYSFPPCVRLIVTDSDHLDFGSLFIITCDGGTIGREKYLGNVIIIPDINISKIHAQLKYMADTGRYYVMDYGSQNGTFLNEERISESKCSSTFLPVNHGDSLQIGCTRFLLHIHPGSETCDECEPGQVKAAFQAQQTKDIQILSKEEKKKQARQELNQIKKKYGLKNTAYIDNNEVIKNPNYQDRAEERRKTKGSDNPYQVDEAPSSVHRPITENNVGHKLLKKMGWSEGESLGKDNSGIQDPVCVSFRMNQKAGLGSEAVCSSSLDDVGEGNKSKRWLEAQQRYRKAIAEKQIPTPAWVKESKLKPSDFL